MVASRTVDAKWTFEHERTFANAEVMYISGALKAGDSLLQGIDYPVGEISAHSISSESTSNVAKGACFCGQAQFELPHSLQPLLSAICHCRDCQEWNMSGSVPMVLYKLEKQAGASHFHIPIQVSLLFHVASSLVHNSRFLSRYDFNQKINDALGVFFLLRNIESSILSLCPYPTLTYSLVCRR